MPANENYNNNRTDEAKACPFVEHGARLSLPRARPTAVLVDSQGDVKVMREKGVLRNISATIVP
jgi:hypothetical protein